VAQPQGLPAHLAAFGICEVVDENMAAAARAHAVDWGAEAAGRTLVAYGGAAPLHAASLADKLRIDRVVVPAGAGVGSAIGFLLAPISYEVVRSRYQRLSAFDPEAANAVMADMFEEAAEVVRAAIGDEQWRETRRAYMRYAGQGYEIAVDVPVEMLTAEHGAALRQSFDEAYQRLYARLIPGLDVEVLSWTLSLIAREPPAPVPVEEPPETTAAPAATAQVFDATTRSAGTAAVFVRGDLEPGARARGPALVVEDQTTTFVSAGFDFRVDGRGHLVLERREEPTDE
jgi:N-methylhydantoinase A